MSNTKINLSEEYQRAQDKTKGITAETKKGISAEVPVASASTNIQNNDTTNPKPQKSGYATVDTVAGGNALLGVKKEYEAGQNAFHQSDTANQLRTQADTIRKDNNLSNEKFGSGVTSKDVLAQYEIVNELGNIKSEFEEKNALDPSFAQSEEGRALMTRANEIRSKYGLSDEEYGNGVTSADVLGKANAIKGLYDVKNTYENYYNNTPEAQSLNQKASDIRTEYSLPEELYGASVSSKDVARYLKELENSSAHQRDLDYQKYQEANRVLSDELIKELSAEEKMRAVLDRVQAEKIAEEQVGMQLDKEIRDSLAYEDELAAQRGSYGQLSYGKRRALKEDALLDNRANRVLQLVDSLIAEDRAKANQEYQEALARKQGRIDAIGQQMNQNTSEFQLGQQYRNEVSQEESARQKALYENVKAQYDQAFQMSNSLGYITPELSSLTGIEAGTPMMKMVEHYGDLEKFYANLEQQAMFKAEDLAIAQYNAETDRIYATRPQYSYGNYYNSNNSNKPTLSYEEAKGIYEKFVSDYSYENRFATNSNGEKYTLSKEKWPKPDLLDAVSFLEHSGFSYADQEQILIAAGYTNSQVKAAIAQLDVRDAIAESQNVGAQISSIMKSFSGDTSSQK